jgi:hypothetical protein
MHTNSSNDTECAHFNESCAFRESPIVQADAPKRDLAKLGHGMASTGREDVVIRLRCLEHQPHCLHVIRGIAPIAGRIETAKMQLRVQSDGDTRNGGGNFARHEVESASRTFMIEENAGARKDVVIGSIRADHAMRK